MIKTSGAEADALQTVGVEVNKPSRHEGDNDSDDHAKSDYQTQREGDSPGKGPFPTDASHERQVHKRACERSDNSPRASHLGSEGILRRQCSG